MKYYKLLTQDLMSHGGTKWTLGEWKEIKSKGTRMCSPDVFHFYNHPILAVLLNPMHADIEDPRIFELEIDEVCNTDGLKYACKKQRIVKEVEPPVLTTDQRVEFGIRCAMMGYNEKSFVQWASRWLSGEDKAESAARAAESAASAAESAARAARAARAAASAAWAAASAAESAAESAARAAESAARAARAAASTAESTAESAAERAAAIELFNEQLIKIAEGL